MPKRMLQGVVVSDKQDKTVVVRVERRYTHPVMKKTVRRSKKYYAHDEKNETKTGDRVLIVRGDLAGSTLAEGLRRRGAEVDDDVFGVNLIPHTWDVTTLGELRPGSRVNLEIDMLARYLARWRETA